jgi:hypothetical protein
VLQEVPEELKARTDIGMMVCTEPLPNERVPTTVARRWSWSGPEGVK